MQKAPPCKHGHPIISNNFYPYSSFLPLLIAFISMVVFCHIIDVHALLPVKIPFSANFRHHHQGGPMFFSSPKQWHSFKYYTTRKEAMAWRLGRLHFSSMKIVLKLRKGEERSNLILGGNLVPCCFAADKSKESERKKRNKKKKHE